jgi:VWFA-related protein
MRTLSQVLAAFFCWFLFPTFAQQGAPSAQVTPQEKHPAALAPRTDRRITLDAAVTDNSGSPVSGLNQQDFTIFDNKKPQKILSFRAASQSSKAADRPLQAIVILDTVNSSFERAAYQRIQLEKFLRKDGGKLPLPMSLVIFSDTSIGQTVTTRDGNTLVNSLNSKKPGLRMFGKSQGFYGAEDRWSTSLEFLDKFALYQATQPGRKLLIWLGPGWPLFSEPGVLMSSKTQGELFQNVVGLSTALRKARVTIYNVDGTESQGKEFYYESFLKGVGSANDLQPGNLALQVLAAQSGGKVLNLSNDIAGSIADCLVDATVFYTLSFDSPVAGHPNEYHSLEVKIGKSGLTGRMRTGYYAQP